MKTNKNKLIKIIKEPSHIQFNFENDINISYSSNLVPKNINIPLLLKYINSLSNSANFKIYYYICCLKNWIDIENITIYLNVMELETLKIISELFNIEEFEKFKDEFLEIEFNDLKIVYNLTSKKIEIDKIAFTDTKIYFLIYDFKFKYSSFLIPPLNFKKGKLFKLLLYMAYKQNNLSNLKNELEKTLF